MNNKTLDNFSHYFDKWKKNLINLGLQRNLLNKELENYINNIGVIEYEVYKSLFDAKEFYSKKRDYSNQKIKSLKEKKYEYEGYLKYFKNEIKYFSEPKIVSENSASIQLIRFSIKDIDNKINALSKKIEEEPLDIVKESTVIESIHTLENEKKDHLNKLKKLEQDLIREQQNNIYFRILRSIEILEVNLNKVYENLEMWSKKRLNSHKNMLNLYRKSREFVIIQKQMEHELGQNREDTNYYFQLFFDLNKQTKKKILEEQVNRFRKKEKIDELPREKPTEVQKPHIKEVIKRKTSQKKHLKKKLAIALEKKKAGKKLEFHELKLILDRSKK